MSITRRKFIGAAAAAGALAASGAAVSGCGSEETTSTEVDKVVVGYWGGTCEAPIFIAKEKGYFEEEGLEAEVTLLDSDGGISSESGVANGELDCYELTPDKFKPIEQGSPMKVIDSLHIGCIQACASKKSGITSVKDLEGKKVAASQGSIAHIMLANQMILEGADPTKVEWLTYKNPMMEAAIDAGEVDAMACYDPYVDIAVKNGKKRFWSWTYDEGVNEILCCFVGCSQLTFENKPNAPKKLAAAFKKATQFLEENPEEAAQIIIDGGYVKLNDDSGFTKDIMVTEIKDYQWLSGDKDVFDKSYKYIWEAIWRAGALDDYDFKTVEEVDEWCMGDMYTQMCEYCGE